MDLQLKGKRALVTGGSKGIGRSIARSLALEGARVVIAARNAGGVHEAVEVLRKETAGDVSGVTFDGMNDASVDAMVNEVVAMLGGLDIVVNGASTPAAPVPHLSVSNTKSEDVLSEYDGKFVNYLRVARAAAPHLAANGWGRIINIGGLASRITGKISGATRNAAVIALTKNLAEELGPKGVNVTVVHPGPTRTPNTTALLERRAKEEGSTPEEMARRMFPAPLIGRMVDAEEVAWVVTFLASPRSVAITGDAVCAGGGVPGTIWY